MSTKEVVVFIILYLVIFYFLAHEIHTAYIIHVHNKWEKEKEAIRKAEQLQKPSCSTCANNQLIDPKKGLTLCSVTGYMDTKEVCSFYRKCYPTLDT